jgi:thioredoxin-related protein
MLLFFEAEDCSYCKRMLKDVLSEPRVQDWYNERFVSIAVDIYGDVELTDFDGITLPSKVFTDHRQIFLTPVIAFIDLKGNEIYRHLGMIATPEEFLLLGEYIAGEHHYRMEFKTYAEQHNMRDEVEILMTPARENE